MGGENAFLSYGQPLATVTSFCYLGLVLTEIDDYWPADVSNLRKSRRS